MNDITFSLSAAFDRQLFWQGGGSVRYLVARLKAETTTQTQQRERTPLNVALVIDVSGSMEGEKLIAAKEAALGLAERLTSDDRLSLVSFASEVEVHLDAVSVTPDNLERIRAEIRRLRTRGRTHLSGGWLAGVECSARVAEAHPGLTPRVILISDGQANAGVTDHSELFEYAGELRVRGALTSALGIGNDYDEHLLRGIAEHGGGRLHDAELVDEIGSVLHGELDDILLTLVENTKVMLTAPGNVVIEPLGSAAFRTESGTTTVAIGSVQGGIDRLVVFKVTCPEADTGSLFGHSLEFSVTATGRLAANQQETVSSGPVLLSLEAATGAENSAQPRDKGVAGTVMRHWSAHIVAEAASLNRERAYREAERYADEQLYHFRRYADGLEGGRELCRDLQTLVHRIGRRTSSRSTKEMYLQSKQVMESRTDRRGMKPGWAERLDEDK
jgi:Ca-activated chloride channel family protein